MSRRSTCKPDVSAPWVDVVDAGEASARIVQTDVRLGTGSGSGDGDGMSMVGAQARWQKRSQEL